MYHQSQHRLWLVASLMALHGCTGTPQLAVAPQVSSPRWSSTATTGTSITATPTPGEATSGADFGKLLGSPELTALITRAQSSSPSLLAAAARIGQARALVRLARGASLPTLSIGTNISANSLAGGRGLDFASNFATIDAALSINLAGAGAAGKRSAVKRAMASEFDRDALVLAMSAEIARTFVARSGLQGRIGLIDQSIAKAAQLQRIIELRQREGVAAMVDVGLQTIRVQQLRAERERLELSLEQTRVALALMVGVEAPEFDATPADIQALSIPDIAPPPPSTIIAIRPDVRAAEARVAAAGGDVEQARAAFFPQLDLSLGRNAQSFLGSGLLSGLSIGASLMAPIFSRNRLSGNLDFSAAQQRESVQVYRQVLLTALTDIEGGLSTADHARKRSTILASMTSEARRTAALARIQYLEGDADLRHLLDAQDLLINAQDAELVSRQERLEAAIALYRNTRG